MNLIFVVVSVEGSLRLLENLNFLLGVLLLQRVDYPWLEQEHTTRNIVYC